MKLATVLGAYSLLSSTIIFPSEVLIVAVGKAQTKAEATIKLKATVN